MFYPTKDCLIAKVLFYQEEIQEMLKSQAKVDVTKQELDMISLLLAKYDDEDRFQDYNPCDTGSVQAENETGWCMEGE